MKVVSHPPFLIRSFIIITALSLIATPDLFISILFLLATPVHSGGSALPPRDILEDRVVFDLVVAIGLHLCGDAIQGVLERFFG